MKYCENCKLEHLNNYIIDSLGSVFCSEKCYNDSFDYRELIKGVDVEIVEEKEITKELLNKAIFKALKEIYDVDINDLSSELDYNISLEHDYFNLLNSFEEHLKTIISINNKEKEEELLYKED